MPRMTQVLPDLAITDAMFEAAADAVAEHAPASPPLTWETMTDPTSWWLIPTPDAVLSKAELVLHRTPDLTVKVNVWHAPDLRGDGKPLPHNHPWREFTGHVVLGGYTEDRYLLADDGQVDVVPHIAHASPTTNTVGKDVFHEVTSILGEPGRTVSIMVCGTGQRGAWGHLDIDTATYHQVDLNDPEFTRLLAAFNPHQG
ncbi:hypothetical protein [Actinomadura atramentaria]|uniref:hypothetical protein n=1 Tax=Actinomadura atramentaria TaxID=1990 RepID=UPI0003A6AF71|nr:hypothetical protein [Actinomadura atramentaria]